jgi:hypothetical protein
VGPREVWTQRLEEKSFRLSRGSNLDRPVVQPVARLSELHGSPFYGTFDAKYVMDDKLKEHPYRRICHFIIIIITNNLSMTDIIQLLYITRLKR